MEVPLVHSFEYSNASHEMTQLLFHLFSELFTREIHVIPEKFFYQIIVM